MALIKNKPTTLSNQEKELLLRFITEDYNCRMELIVDTPENILHDIIKYKGFAYNMYKHIIDKISELKPLENKEDGIQKSLYYGNLIIIMAKILDDER